MKSIHAAVAREPRIAHGIGFKSRHLTGGTDSPREPNAVDAEMRAQIPAAPALDIAEVDQGVVHRRLLRAAPIGTPRIKGPARTRRNPAAHAHRPKLEPGDGEKPVEHADQGDLGGGLILSAISSSG